MDNANAPVAVDDNLHVTNAFIDFENNLLYLTGTNFYRNETPKVALGLQILPILSFSSDSLIAEMPTEIIDGDLIFNMSTDGAIKLKNEGWYPKL